MLSGSGVSGAGHSKPDELHVEIDMGIAAREFELFCQPLVNARTQECIGVEILLRWNNPRQGWISPEVFVPLAEEHNLIVPLTRYVIAETVRQIGYFPPPGLSHRY